MFFSVATQQGPGIVIAHPGQNVTLSCDVTPSGSELVAWLINHIGPYGGNAIYNGLVSGYTTTNLLSNNLIVENIMMNDSRNDTEYHCVIVTLVEGVTEITQMGNSTILYVAGE